MTAILFALISFVGWGAGDVFIGVSTRKLGALITTFWLWFLGILLPLVYVPFVLSSLTSLTSYLLLIIIILAILQVVASLSYIEALRIGNASIVGTISGSFTAVVVVLSLIFLGETLFRNQIVSILIIFLGIILCSFNPKDIKAKKLLNKGTVLAFVAMISWGIALTFIKIPIRELGWFWPTYIDSFIGTLMIFILVLRKKGKSVLLVNRQDLFILFMGASLPTVGLFSFNYAVSLGQSSVVAPIAGSSVTLFVLLSRFVFKDRLTSQQWLGIVTTICGVVLLAIVS